MYDNPIGRVFTAKLFHSSKVIKCFKCYKMFHLASQLKLSYHFNFQKSEFGNPGFEFGVSNSEFNSVLKLTRDCL